jgi:hypothetical protein
MLKFKRVYLFFVFTFIAISPSITQAQSAKISGVVVDVGSNMPVVFAHIRLKEGSEGTVSNEEGRFDFFIKLAKPGDTLLISCIGYSSLRVALQDIAKYNGVFKLAPSPVMLDEIVVKEQRLTPEEILEKAIDNLQKNISYPNKPFKLDGFFRYVYQTDKRNKSVGEMAFNIYDQTDTQPMQNIDIIEFRKLSSKDYKSDVGDESFEALNQLLGISVNFNFLTHRGLKNGKTAWAVGKRPYKLEYSSYKDRPVYIVSHKSKIISMKVVVDADTYAVLRNEYKSTVSPDDYENFNWSYSGGPSITCGYYTTHQIYEYREYGGKFYPSFFYRAEDSRCYNKQTKEKVSDNLRYFQLLINNIEAVPSVSKSKGSKAKLNAPYNPKFWEGYNIITDLPVSQDVVEDLGSWNK